VEVVVIHLRLQQGAEEMVRLPGSPLLLAQLILEVEVEEVQMVAPLTEPLVVQALLSFVI
jgi:hypothetical protein